MASIARLTNNTDETDVASFVSKDNIFSIPFFQRPYKWKPERIKRFQEDILNLVDEQSDFHFLGAVIVHGRRTNPSDPDMYEVIDGQQRLTTIYLMLCATVKCLCEQGEFDEASAIFQKYVAINRNLANMSNARVQSCKEDRAQMNHVIRDVISDGSLLERLGSFRFKQLPIAANSKDKGVLRNNYNAMLRFLRNEISEGGVERLRDVYSCLLNKVTIVQIDVKDPASGPAIFDSLNSRQEPMTIGDLVRNGIFSKVASLDPDEVEIIDQESWQPFYGSFEHDGKNYFDSYFFPYGLVENPNLKKSEVYSWLQKKWAEIDDPKKIVADLSRYQAAFMDLMCGTNTSNHPAELAVEVSRFRRMNAPSSALPFLMQLSRAANDSVISVGTACGILKLIESFLVRRAICGIEPTGLHAVFKRLWRDLGKDISTENAKKIIAGHRTVSWPRNEEVAQDVRERSLYGSSITPFLIQEYNLSLGGDVPPQVPWIEHVLPQKPSDSWWNHFSNEEHDYFVDTLANLIPLSEKMNRDVGNSAYPVKRKVFEKDSMYKSAREFASKYETWDSDKLHERAALLAHWAIERWPY